MAMAKAEGSKPKPKPKATPKSKPKSKLKSALKVSTIWVRLSGDVGNEVFSIECVADSTTIDDLKKLIKMEYSPILNSIPAQSL